MLRRISNDRRGLLLSIAGSILFGMHPAAIRAVYADGGNALFMMLATTGARALALTLYCLGTRKALFATRAHTREAFIGGFCQAFSIVGILAALTFIPGPLVIIVVFTHTLMLLFFLAWRGEVRLDAMTVATTLAALAGLTLVLNLWHAQPAANLWGIGLAFAAAVATVFRLYVFGKQTRERNPAVVAAENFLTAILFLLPILFFKRPQAPATPHGYGWTLLACLAFASATFAMFYSISFIGSFRWSLFAKLEPLFTALFSAWFIHEVLQPSQYLGIAVVTGSLLLYQSFHRPRAMVVDEAAASV